MWLTSYLDQYKGYAEVSYNDEDYLRTRSFRMVLTPDEADRLKQQASELGISQAAVFRRALHREVFDDVDVKPGRKEGISPQRRTG